MKITAYELVFLGDAHSFVHTRHHVHFEISDFLFVADNAHNRDLITLGEIYAQAVLLDLLHHFLQFFIRSRRFHDNNHNTYLQNTCSEIRKARPRIQGRARNLDTRGTTLLAIASLSFRILTYPSLS